MGQPTDQNTRGIAEVQLLSTDVTTLTGAVACGFVDCVDDNQLGREVQATDVKKSLSVVRKALRGDKKCYLSWKTSIAIAFVDEYLNVFGDDYILLDELVRVANAAAKNFLDRLIKE